MVARLTSSSSPAGTGMKCDLAGFRVVLQHKDQSTKFSLYALVGGNLHWRGGLGAVGVSGAQEACLQRSAGNICRSPSAEAVFKDVVKKAGLSSSFHIDSCGTGGGNENWCVSCASM